MSERVAVVAAGDLGRVTAEKLSALVHPTRILDLSCAVVPAHDA